MTTIEKTDIPATPVPTTVIYTWTGPPGVVWIQRPPLFIILLTMLIPLMLGFVGAVLIFAPAPYSSAVELTDAERRSAYLQQKLWPLTMKLRVISEEQFNREIPDSRTIAFSQPADTPCVITIPDSWIIEFSPGISESPRFSRFSNGNTIAHEMLHCYRGYWHPQSKVSTKP